MGEIEDIMQQVGISDSQQGVFTSVKPPFDLHFSEFGHEVIDLCMKCQGLPILLLGESGGGKTIIARELARRADAAGCIANHGHPGELARDQMGQNIPRETEQGNIGIQWVNGQLTRAIREGYVYLYEELTRAPQSIQGRIFGALDTGHPTFELPEAGLHDIPVHKDFWFIGTANPPTSDYATMQLDKAFLERFQLVIPCGAYGLADEQKIMEGILTRRVYTEIQLSFPPSTLIDKILKVVADIRTAGIALSTRSVVQWALMLAKGFTNKQVFDYNLKFKYEKSEQILAALHAHGMVNP